MNTRISLRSFTGGEMSPEMFGLVDDAKFQRGAAKLTNFLVKPHGPARTRPGFAYVRGTKTNQVARLIPFTFSNDQTVVIEIGVGYFRFHSEGATLTATRAYTASASVTFIMASGNVTWVLHGLSVGDQVAFRSSNGAGGQPTGVPYGQATPATSMYVAEVVDVNNVRLAASPSGATITSYASAGTGTITGHFGYERGDAVVSGGTTYYCLTANIGTAPPNASYWQAITSGIYEVPHDYTADELFDIHFTQSNDVVTLVHPAHPAKELSRYSTARWSWDSITFGSDLDAPVGLSVATNTGEALDVATVRACTAAESATYVGAVCLTLDGPADRYALGDYLIVRDSGLTQMDGLLWVLHTKLSSTKVLVTAFQGGAMAKLTNPVTTSFWYVTTDGTANTVTWANQALANGTAIRLGSDGGATGVPDTTTYYVINSNNAVPCVFQISTSVGGAAETALGTQATTNPGPYIVLYNDAKLQLTDVSTDSSNTYCVTAVDLDGAETVASSSVTATNNLYVAGAYNTLTWTGVVGAARYRVYKMQSGLFGFIGEVESDPTNGNATGPFIDDNIGPDMGVSPPIEDTTLNGTDYPGAVGYFEQRRFFGGTPDYPQKVWATRTGTEKDLNYSLPIKDTDRLSFEVFARERSTVRHIVPMSQLILLTDSSELRVSPVNSDALTPTSVAVRPQSYIGASNAQPLVVNNSLLFCAARGGHVREMGFSADVEGFLTGDLSLRAAHLFDGETIVDMAYGKAPYPVVYCTSSDGSLLALTYVPEQQVAAWSQITTDGEFESCCVVAEGDEDRLYVVVKRTINGSTVRYVERMAAQIVADLEDQFCVDAGVTTTSNSLGVVSGLSHLNGETVSVLADGVVQEQQTVAAGSITIDAVSAATVHVGLPYTCDLQTLPLAMQIEGYGQGRQKNVNKAWVRVVTSGVFELGPGTDDLVESDPYQAEDYETTGEVEVVPVGTWTEGGQIYVRQSDPVPLTVVGITLEVSIGG